jgi:hypothetical protein
MFDFPASPTDGTIYAPPTGPQYQYSGGAWRVASSSVPIATAESRNRIYNPAFQISQENGSTASATAAANTGYYAADQWITRWDLSAGTALGKQWDTTGGVTPNGSATYVTFSVAAAVTSLAAGSYAITTQNIEGKRVVDFGWGAAGAKQAVLRFWVTAPAGTYSVAILNSASNRSYVAQYTSAGSGWELKSLVIPGDVTGTWLKDTAIGISLNFVWAVGSTYVGVLGWQAATGGKYAGPGQATSLGAGTNYSIADVGLHLDPLATGVAPTWQMPDEAAELLACQRYWRPLMVAIDAYETSGMPVIQPVALIPNMRVAPALAQGASPSVSNVGGFSGLGGSYYGIYIQTSIGTTGRGYYYSGPPATLNSRM